MRYWLTLLLCLLSAPAALAHQPSETYLTLRDSGNGISGHWDLALRDLEAVVGLDSNADARITWGEVRRQRATIAEYALARLDLRRGDGHCSLAPGELAVVEHLGTVFARLYLAGGCDGSGPLQARYDLLFDLDSSHRGLVTLMQGEQHSLNVFTAERRQAELFAPRSGWQRFVQFFGLGTEHILAGLDHLLFLAVLLLPAVLTRAQGRWVPAASARGALITVLTLVTAFTLAHSLTLALAVLGLWNPAGGWIEPVIAASIIVIALNNLWPLLAHGRWAVVFLFGLVHGLGFAGALASIGLPPQHGALALLGFNLGVEAVQIGLVLLFLPCAWALRHTRLYRIAVLYGGSLAVAVIASYWLWSRLAA